MGVYLAFIMLVLSDCSHRACMDSKQSLILSFFLTSYYLHSVVVYHSSVSTIWSCSIYFQKATAHLKGVNFNSGSLKGFHILMDR